MRHIRIIRHIPSSHRIKKVAEINLIKTEKRTRRLHTLTLLASPVDNFMIDGLDNFIKKQYHLLPNS